MFFFFLFMPVFSNATFLTDRAHANCLPLTLLLSQQRTAEISIVPAIEISSQCEPTVSVSCAGVCRESVQEQYFHPPATGCLIRAEHDM
jgi:hypothetical protein